MQSQRVGMTISKRWEVRKDGHARIWHLRLLRSLRDEGIPVGRGGVRSAPSRGAGGRTTRISLLLFYRAPEFSRLLCDRPECLPDRLGLSNQCTTLRSDDLPAALP